MIRLSLVTGLLFLSSVVMAATPTITATETPPLADIKDLLRLAMKRSPELKQAEAEVKVTESQTDEARSLLYPKVELKGAITARDNPAGTSTTSTSTTGTSEDYQAYLEATQPILSGGILSGLKLQKQQEDIQRLKLLNTRQGNIESVTQAYYNINEKLRLLTAAQNHQQILKNYAATIRRYTQIGRARKTDRLQAEVNLMTAEAEVKELEAQYQQELEGLRQLLAIEELPALTPVKDIETLQYEKIKTTQAIQKSLASHPEILIAQLTLEKVSNEKSVALASDMPSLKLTGQVGYRSPDEPDLFKNTSEYSQVALNLNVPMFSALSSLDIRRRYEQEKVIQTRELEKTKITIETDLKAKISQLETSMDRLRLSRQAHLDARTALDLANRDHQQGLISSQDLINVQRTRYEAEKLYVRTQFNYLKTLLEARRLMGIDLWEIYGK